MEKLLLDFLRLVPKNALSRGVGLATRAQVPRVVHGAAIKAFVKAFKVCVEDAEMPPGDYRSFADFFTRKLRPGARTVDSDPDVLVSPCDGVVGAVGAIEKGMLFQAKGRPYALESLLSDTESAGLFEGGEYLTIYLAPHDYHRVHFPATGAVIQSRHVPGTLWPVNPPAIRHVQDLFAVNERLITYVDTRLGPIAVVMVGATCVGRIRMLYDDGVTNAGVDLGVREYDEPIPVKKGDELGVFEMGSTVIVLVGPDSWRLAAVNSSRPPGREGQRDILRMGCAIGRAATGCEA